MFYKLICEYDFLFNEEHTKVQFTHDIIEKAHYF